MNSSSVIEKIKNVINQIRLNEKQQDKSSNHNNLKFDMGSPMLQSLLPYHAYDHENQLFINHSSVGVGFELNSLTGANEDVIRQWHRIIRMLPKKANWFGQFIRYQHNKVGDRLKENFLTQPFLPEFYAKHQLDYYEYAARFGFYNKLSHPIRLLDNRYFFFIYAQAGKNIESKILEILKVRDQFESELQGNSLGFNRINEANFISFVREILNYNPDNIYPTGPKNWSIDKYTPINNQITDKNLEWLHDPDGLSYQFDDQNHSKVSGYITALTTFKKPDNFALWQVPDNFSSREKPSAGITCPYIYSLTFSLMAKHTSVDLVSRKVNKHKKALNTTLERIWTNLREAHKEWDSLKKSLENDEADLAESQEVLILINRDEKEAAKSIAAANNAFSLNGFELIRNRYFQLPLILSAMPFMMAEGLWDDKKIIRLVEKKPTSEIVNKLPIIGDYKGSHRGILLSSFRNQYAGFDLFSEEIGTNNMNMAIAANSGSGKSVTANKLLEDVLGRGGKAWVIDKGASYRNSCKVFGGVYLKANTLALNPFTFVKNILEDAEQIRDFFAVLASPNTELSSVQRAYLNEAVMMAFEKSKNETTIDDLIEALEEINADKHDLRVSDMVVLLQPYRKEGQYGRYFNERSELDPTARLTVLELDGLPDSLLRAVLFALFVLINEQMYLAGRSLPKICIIDEAWKLLSGDNKQASQFIETGYRTARKHHGSFCSITQGVNDYFDSKEAQAAWDNADIKIIMAQSSRFKEVIKKLEGYFSPVEESLIRQFKEVKKTGYASFLLKAGTQASFNRLFIDPYSRIAFSTDGPQFEAVEKLLQQGMSIEKAIEQTAQQFFGKEIALINEMKKNDRNRKEQSNVNE